MPSLVRLSEWFLLRRARSALITAALLLFIISMSHFANLITRSVLPLHINDSLPAIGYEGVRWNDFAYGQYVTNENYLCNSLMILEALNRFGAKADRIMMYPESWKVPEGSADNVSTASNLLVQARDLYGAKLVPIQVQSVGKGDTTWMESFTKLLAFNQTQYKRVMSLDSDATIQNHMDELFLLPSSPVAMPRAYWLAQPFLSSQLVLVEPSSVEWHRVQQFINRDDSGFDMDILNIIYKNSSIVIPHRKYDLLTSEFRFENHENYLGSDETWDGAKVLEEAKFVHFSDWPMPKPWLKASDSVTTEMQPNCKENKDGGQPDCRDRDIWLNLYKDFSDRRQRICGRSDFQVPY